MTRRESRPFGFLGGGRGVAANLRVSERLVWHARWMLGIDYLESDGVLVLRPEGPLSADDFQQAAAEADRVIGSVGEIGGVMIDAKEFPGWKDFAALSAHLRFVRDHHKEIRKVAIVSDSGFASALPAVARHFVNADVRKYERDDVGAAMMWLSAPAEDEVSALRYSYFPRENLFWVAVNGKVTSAGYKEMLKRMDAAVAASPEPLNFLIDVNDLAGVELGALWEDAKFGLFNFDKIGRVAIVADHQWLERVTKLVDPITKVELKSFKQEHEYEAWQWING